MNIGDELTESAKGNVASVEFVHVGLNNDRSVDGMSKMFCLITLLDGTQVQIPMVDEVRISSDNGFRQWWSKSSRGIRPMVEVHNAAVRS